MGGALPRSSEVPPHPDPPPLKQEGVRTKGKPKPEELYDFTITAGEALPPVSEREILIDNLLVRVHLIIGMILAHRPCATGV